MSGYDTMSKAALAIDDAVAKINDFIQYYDTIDIRAFKGSLTQISLACRSLARLYDGDIPLYETKAEIDRVLSMCARSRAIDELLHHSISLLEAYRAEHEKQKVR